MEEDKKTRTILISVICVLVAIILVGGYFIIRGEKENSKLSLDGGYKAFVQRDEENGEDDYYYLYLRKDGTFRFNDSIAVNAPYVGNYEKSNDKLLLKATVTYGSDSCFYKNAEFLKQFEFDINKDGTLKYHDSNNKEYTFEKDDNVRESGVDLKHYVTDPVNGTVIDSSDWIVIDCTDEQSSDTKWEAVQYKSEFKEDGTTIIDYDMKTDYDINFKAAYDLVIAESSKLKNKSGVNLFDYVGRVSDISNYHYINYDAYLYNLPQEEYDKVRDQLLEDKNVKTANCFPNSCSMKITKGYESLSNNLVKKAFYYYIFDGNDKIETRDILSKYFVTSNIPDEWLSLGNYKTKDDMFKDVLIMDNESHTYKNYLVIYVLSDKVIFKYKGKSKTVIDNIKSPDDYAKLFDKSYDVNRDLSCIEKHIDNEDAGAVVLSYKSDHKISADYSHLLNELDFSNKTKYYCYSDLCKTKESDLYDYYKSDHKDSDKTSGFADEEFEIKDGYAYVNYQGQAYKFDKVKDVISVKAIVSVEFGPKMVLLDKNNNLYYVEVHHRGMADDKYGTDFENYGLIAKDVVDFDVFNDFAVIDLEPSPAGGEAVAIHNKNNQLLYSGLYYNGKLLEFNNIKEFPYHSFYKQELINGHTFETVVSMSQTVSVKYTNDKEEFEKYDGKEINTKYIIFDDYRLYVVTNENDVLYYDLKDCNGTYKKYNTSKVSKVENNSSSKKAKIYYENGSTEEINYGYFFN